MSMKLKYNPLVKKGFDLYKDIENWVQNNFAAKNHTHDYNTEITNKPQFFEQSTDPAENNSVEEGDYWIVP